MIRSGRCRINVAIALGLLLYLMEHVHNCIVPQCVPTHTSRPVGWNRTIDTVVFYPFRFLIDAMESHVKNF
jgi:hypothetical protein